MTIKAFRPLLTARREFDPSAKKDLLELKYFNDTGSWKNGCPFYLEEPFVEIPAMCYFKYTRHMLSKMNGSSK